MCINCLRTIKKKAAASLGEEEGVGGEYIKMERSSQYIIYIEYSFPFIYSPFTPSKEGGGEGGEKLRGVSMFSTYILIFIYKYIIYILKTTQARKQKRGVKGGGGGGERGGG